MERLVEVYEKYNRDNLVKPKELLVYVANLGDNANVFATKLVYELRKNNVYALKDISGRSFKICRQTK